MTRERERGFVLLAVLLVLSLLAVVVTELAFSARLEASMVRSYRDGVLARHLAEAAVQQAIREIATPAQVAALDETGQLVFYRVLPGQTTPTRLPALPRARVPLGAGEFSYRLADESARLELNTPAPNRFARLLDALQVDPSERDIIVDSLQDWRDADELPRLHGAESEFYLGLPVPYRARNANLQDVAELLQIRGVTPELFWGAGDRPGLGDLVTAAAASAVNLNTASPLVLKALGLSDAEIADVVQTRARAPYPSVPGRFASRGLAVGSSVFRIEAEGRVAGVVRSRVVAIVQRGRRNAPLEATILSWRPGPEA
jgi:general secretion pathway protein K